MCRVLAYLGEPISLAHVLYETDSSLVRQSYSPRMMATFLNLAGFGMVAWDPRSVRAEDPFTYRVTDAAGLRPQPAQPGRQARADVPRSRTSAASPTASARWSRRRTCTRSASPARGVALAHNGHLREFARMRYDLVGHVRPELAQRIEGTTDSEWIYALVLSQLEDPYGLPETRELADATAAALRILRDVRARHGIDTSSPVNLCLATGRCARRHALLVRLRLVSRRGRAARDGPAVREPLVHGSAASTSQRDGGSAMARQPTSPARC